MMSQNMNHRRRVGATVAMVAAIAVGVGQKRVGIPSSEADSPEAAVASAESARAEERELAACLAGEGEDQPPEHATESTLGGLSAEVVREVGGAQGRYEIAGGELVVQPGPQVSLPEFVRSLEALGARVLSSSERSGLLRITVPHGETEVAFGEKVAALPGTLSAHPNAIARGTSLTACPAGNHRTKQWNLDRLQVPGACAAYNPALSQVVVAVLDTGVAYEDYAPGGSERYLRAGDLRDVGIEPGWDFVNNDAHPNDDHQHGTHIASLIASQGNASGVAPGVRVMPVKVLDRSKTGTELQLVEGIYYAVDHGADIINMSLSFGVGYYPSPSLQAAILYAADNDVLLVSSVGNSNNWGITFPGAFPQVLSVGATRITYDTTSKVYKDKRASYSDSGARLDVMAPAGLVNTDVDKNGQPDASLALTIQLNKPTTVKYYYLAGTSQASAHVAGVAAWLLADGVPPSEVKWYVEQSAHDIENTHGNFDFRSGAGMVALQDARTLAATGVNVTPPPIYVSTLPAFVQTDLGESLRVRVEVRNAAGNPLPDANVGVVWYGSYTHFKDVAKTNSSGIATFESPARASGTAVAIGFQVDKVFPAGRVHANPTLFYSLTPAMAEVYAQLMANPAQNDSMLLFHVDNTNQAAKAKLGATTLLPTWFMHPVGAGMATGPIVVALNAAFAPALADPATGASSPVTFSFAAPLPSGWGPISEVNATRVNTAVPQLGSSSSYLVLPVDADMSSFDLSRGYPVLNVAGERFLEDNRTFGNGFASSALGSGFASSALGSGFASSSLGDGFASSALGSGFASSALGSGFASSAMASSSAATAVGMNSEHETLLPLAEDEVPLVVLNEDEALVYAPEPGTGF